jgi:hypothetical protein
VSDYHDRSLDDAVTGRIARRRKRTTPNPPHRGIRMLPVDIPIVVSAESLRSSRRVLMIKHHATSLC